MGPRDKIEHMVEGVNKLASLWQYTSWEDMIHNVRYKMDYYMIHARLNYYSNSKNPRVIQTRFQNQKLTSLRTNPHDPYFVRPGEFLTLAKRNPDPEQEFDELLSCYNQRKIANYRDMVPAAGSHSKLRRPVSEGMASIAPDISTRESNGLARDSGSIPTAVNSRLAVRSLNSHRSRGTVRFSSPVMECSRSHTHGQGGYCPIHLVPHPLMRDLALSRHLALGSEAGKYLIQSCESHTRLPPKPPLDQENVGGIARLSTSSCGQDKTESFSLKRERSWSRKDKDTTLEQGKKPRLVSQQSQSSQRSEKSYHSHISDISLMIANSVNAAVDYVGKPRLKDERQGVKTKKIRRKLVRRPTSMGTICPQRPKSDSSIVTGEVTTHLLELYSSHDDGGEQQHQREGHHSFSERAQLEQPAHFVQHPKLDFGASKMPVSVPRSIANNGTGPVRSAGSLMRPNTNGIVEGRYEFSQKTLRSRELYENGLRRPLSTRVFKSCSLRTHSKDARCRCSACNDTKVWQVVLSDISLSAARFSTGSDVTPSSRQSRSLIQIRPAVSRENASKGHGHFGGLSTMLFLNSMDEWYD